MVDRSGQAPPLAPLFAKRGQGRTRAHSATIDDMKILVLEARGLHLGFLGCYGNNWIATPNLDRVAAEGVVFDRHFHDCPGESHARSAELPRVTLKLDKL